MKTFKMYVKQRMNEMAAMNAANLDTTEDALFQKDNLHMMLLEKLKRLKQTITDTLDDTNMYFMNMTEDLYKFHTSILKTDLNRLKHLGNFNLLSIGREGENLTIFHLDYIEKLIDENYGHTERFNELMHLLSNFADVTNNFYKGMQPKSIEPRVNQEIHANKAYNAPNGPKGRNVRAIIINDQTEQYDAIDGLSDYINKKFKTAPATAPVAVPTNLPTDFKNNNKMGNRVPSPVS